MRTPSSFADPDHRTAVAYRPDIDGLRAVSVLTVIVFHLGARWLPGGFVAVEVFFVISGYLITSIMLRDHALGRFSIANFYYRRVRRLLPALAAFLLATLAVGWLVLLPSELAALGRSTAATALFGSNILLWNTVSYFAPDAAAQPLLHTWTLGIEEQFYIFWPLALAALHRWGLRRWLGPLLLVGIAGSLAAAEVMAHYSSRSAFYLLPFRAWELLLGAAVAYWAPLARPGPRWLRELAAAIGLGLVLVPMFILEETIVFPGLSAVPTCVGTALLILVGLHGSTGVGRVLSLRPLVTVGLISYSLYLVHWPIIAIPSLVQGAPLSTGQACVAFAAALILGWASWRWIEVPLRTPGAGPLRGAGRTARMLGGRWSTAAVAVTALVLVPAAGLAMSALRGFPGRLPPRAAALDGWHQRQPYALLNCDIDESVPRSLAPCLFARDPQRRARTLLWGDSHALHFVRELRRREQLSGQPMLGAVASGCIPLPGVLPVFGHGRADWRCRDFNTAMLRQIEANPQIRRVILSGYWGAFHSPTAWQPGASPNMRYLLAAPGEERSATHSMAVYRAALERLASWLEARGIDLILIGGTPVYRERVPTCLARAEWRDRSPTHCGLTIAEFAALRRDTEPVLRETARRHANVRYYDPAPALCSRTRCEGAAGDAILTWDTHHLSTLGARRALRGLALPPV